MGTHLVACPGCARHVRASEDACPFCKTALSDALRNSRAPMRPPLGLSRAAMYAVGASALAIVAGCSSDPEPLLLTAYGLPIPSGCTFPGSETIGEACNGKTYVIAIPASTCNGFLACYDGYWTYGDGTPPTGYVPLQVGGTAPVDAGDAETDGAADATSDTSADDASDAGDAG